MRSTHSRRRFLATLSSAAVGGLVGTRSRSLAQEGPSETTAIKLARSPSICLAPQYIAGELLRAEGFTDIRYVPADGGIGQSAGLASGEIDLTLHFAAPLIIPIDRGDRITIVGGAHVGCFELIANERVHGIRDLKGKAVGVQSLGASTYIFLSTMAAHVGLDPIKDINWVTTSTARPSDLFIEGKIDAFLSFPPEPQQLRARKIGHVVVNSSIDRPWSVLLLLAGGQPGFRRKTPDCD